ncbi:MAG: hypothetical protein HC862_21850 [Scytonema sp. RU_4_4]|nr:hypothetical protein [Scytonema sp. RU_4_4]
MKPTINHSNIDIIPFPSVSLEEVIITVPTNWVLIVENNKFKVFIEYDTLSLYLLLTEEIDEKEKYKIDKGFKLAIALCSRPSEKLLEVAYTEDLKDFWYDLRIFNFYIGIYFLTSYLKIVEPKTNIPSDDELTEEFIYYEGKRYCEMWNIINLIFPFLKKLFPKILINPQALFIYIIKEEGESLFTEVLIKNFIIFNVREKTKLILEVINLIEKNNYTEVNIDKLSLISLLFLLASQSKKFTKNKRLKFHAENYNTATKYMLDTAYEMGMKRTSKGMFIPSWIWDSGEFIDSPWNHKKKS